MGWGLAKKQRNKKIEIKKVTIEIKKKFFICLCFVGKADVTCTPLPIYCLVYITFFLSKVGQY